MEPFTIEQETSLLRLDAWEKEIPGLVAGFTTRLAGHSEGPFDSMNCGLHVGDDAGLVISNRQALSRKLGFPFEAWTCADQVHGNQVMIVDRSLSGRGKDSHQDAIEQTDGLITGASDILLTSFYADCVPLFFMAPSRRVAGIAHAGWRGTAANIAQAMVEAMVRQFDLDPSEIQAAIGPSIGSCCYEVDEQVVSNIAKNFTDTDSRHYSTELGNGKYVVDLKQANTQLLIQAGLEASRILSSRWCTSCHTDLFYSHRKEAGKTGRMAAFIGWRKEV